MRDIRYRVFNKATRHMTADINPEDYRGINPHTDIVMEATPFYDKNNTRIYEKDVIIMRWGGGGLADGDMLAVIIKNEDTGAFDFKWINEPKEPVSETMGDFNVVCDKAEVIGCMWETPEFGQATLGDENE